MASKGAQQKRSEIENERNVARDRKRATKRQMDTERKAAWPVRVQYTPKRATRTERIQEERTPREQQRKSLRRGREAQQTRRGTDRERQRDRGKERERDRVRKREGKT